MGFSPRASSMLSFGSSRCVCVCVFFLKGAFLCFCFFRKPQNHITYSCFGGVPCFKTPRWKIVESKVQPWACTPATLPLLGMDAHAQVICASSLANIEIHLAVLSSLTSVPCCVRTLPQKDETMRYSPLVSLSVNHNSITTGLLKETHPPYRQVAEMKAQQAPHSVPDLGLGVLTLTGLMVYKGKPGQDVGVQFLPLVHFAWMLGL